MQVQPRAGRGLPNVGLLRLLGAANADAGRVAVGHLLWNDAELLPVRKVRVPRANLCRRMLVAQAHH